MFSSTVPNTWSVINTHTGICFYNEVSNLRSLSDDFEALRADACEHYYLRELRSLYNWPAHIFKWFRWLGVWSPSTFITSSNNLVLILMTTNWKLFLSLESSPSLFVTLVGCYNTCLTRYKPNIIMRYYLHPQLLVVDQSSVSESANSCIIQYDNTPLHRLRQETSFLS